MAGGLQRGHTTTFFVTGRLKPGSDSQPKSEPRKITRNLSPELATFVRTGQPARIRSATM